MATINSLENNLVFLNDLASKPALEILKNEKQKNKDFIQADVDRIIQMAWEDRTPFEAINFQFGLKEKEVVQFMRANSLPSSFKMWRKRMKARKTKHLILRENTINRFKCSMQRSTGNKIAKR